MIRKACMMSVYPDCHEEYKRRHDELWPEMEAMLRRHGALSYSIFLEPASSKLFAYLEIQDEALWSKAAETAICQTWWAYMQDIMETNEDNSPVVTDLYEVFHLS